jgi:hypothetical protein
MRTIRYPFQRFCKVMAVGASLFAMTIPAAVVTLHAAEKPASSPAPSSLKPGDSYGGGKVVYLFVEGEKGYVPGETHGLVAAAQDLGHEVPWERAVLLCKACRGGGFSDWRLPDKSELNMLYMNRTLIGGFKDRHYYWSSTESDKNDAWDQSFRTGASSLGYKLDNNYVRAVRVF